MLYACVAKKRFFVITLTEQNQLSESMNLIVSRWFLKLPALQTVPLQIIHGDPTEHRNIPCSEGFKFMYKYYKQRHITNSSMEDPRKLPENIFNLINNLICNKSLTSYQYDVVLKFLKEQRESQRKLEIGDDHVEPEADAASKSLWKSTLNDPQTKLILQGRIQEILNKYREHNSSYNRRNTDSFADDKMKMICKSARIS